MESGATTRRFECPALPRGWVREEVYRRGGLSIGKCDVYYIPPNGKKVRSKPELIKLLGDTVDLSTFDYSTGTMNSTLIKPRGRMPKTAKDKGDREDVLRANRTQTANLVPPIRQTASIFKQPVTVVKVHESKVKNDFKAAAGAEKPRQLFWEKRLNGLGAKSVAADQFAMELPGSIKRLQAVIGEEGEVATNILLASISTALHLGNGPVTGQADQMEKIDKNPTVYVNPSQPLMASVEVGDKEIVAQEERVQEARDRLASAIKALS